MEETKTITGMLGFFSPFLMLTITLGQFTLLPLEPIVNIKHVSYLKPLGVTFQDMFSPTVPTGICIYVI